MFNLILSVEEAFPRDEESHSSQDLFASSHYLPLSQDLFESSPEIPDPMWEKYMDDKKGDYNILTSSSESGVHELCKRFEQENEILRHKIGELTQENEKLKEENEHLKKD